ENSYRTTLSAGLHTLRYDMHHNGTGHARARLAWSGPGVSFQVVGGAYLSPTSMAPGDYGTDDDFHVLASSPAVDAGDPRDPALFEPGPNGGRVNVGADGNTAAATTSAAQLVQVLNPNGLEKI